jgi:hypothetical protein
MNLLSFSPDYWDGPRHNRHYFCEELSKENKVLFVSPPFYVVKLIRELGKGSLSKSGVTIVNQNLVNYVPSKFLFTNYRFQRINKLFENMRIRRINALLSKYGMKRPVLLIWHPGFKDMIGKFNESLVIYYIYDQYSNYIGGDPSKPDEAEIELLKKSDIVFVLSNKLYEEKKEWNSNIYLLPNAVDYELFSKARNKNTAIPEDLERIPVPRIGYIGTINEKVDLDLLDYISEKKTEWSIVLIGRENFSIEKEKNKFFKLASKKNVYWLGHKKYDLMPACMKGLDVCLMCYIKNNWTYYGDPSKMHEYLASGKPTVATGLAAIKEFDHVIKIPDTKDKWIKAIKDSLEERNQEEIEKRIMVAKTNSYPRRIEVALAIIKEKLIKENAGKESTLK